MARGRGELVAIEITYMFLINFFFAREISPIETSFCRTVESWELNTILLLAKIYQVNLRQMLKRSLVHRLSASFITRDQVIIFCFYSTRRHFY